MIVFANHNTRITRFLFQLSLFDSFPSALIELAALIREYRDSLNWRAESHVGICANHTERTVGEIWVNSHTHTHTHIISCVFPGYLRVDTH